VLSIKLEKTGKTMYKFVFFTIDKADDGSFIGEMIVKDKSKLNEQIDSLTILNGLITTKPLQSGAKVDISFDENEVIQFTYST